MAVCGAQAAYSLSLTPEKYGQFTTGSTTFRHAIKHADFALLVGLSVGFAAAWLMFLLLEQRIQRHAGDEGVTGARGLIGYASLPLLAWVGGLVLWPIDSLSNVYLSAAAVGCAAVALFIGTLRPATPASTPHGTGPSDVAGQSDVARRPDLAGPHHVAGLALLAALLGMLSALVAPFAVNRMLLLARETPIWTGGPAPVVFAIFGALLGLSAAMWAAWRSDRAAGRISAVLVILQLAFPWAYLQAIPLPWRTSAGLVEGLPTGRGLLIVIALVAITYVDLFRRLPGDRVAATSPLRALSPLSLAAILLFIKQPSFAIPDLWTDDYHFGELVLPIWTVIKQGAVPFWDYVPARGLMNYDKGVVAMLAFGAPTAAAVQSAMGFLAIFMTVLLLVVMEPLVGLLPAAVMLLQMPVANSVSEIDIVNTAGLVASIVAYRQLRASTWLVAWCVLCPCLFLWAPAQGSTIILGTMPLAAWQFMKAFRDERRRLRRLLLIATPIVLGVLFVGPFGHMLLGAVRYGTEHAAVAGPAHGIEWVWHATVPGGVNRWMLEMVRTSWMIVPLAGIALISAALLTDTDRDRRQRLLLVGVPIVIIGLLFIYRAAGRIDAGGPSRLGFASLWMLSLLLPLLLHAAWGEGRWPAILAITVAGAGLLAPAFSPLDIVAIARRGLDVPPPAPSSLIDGSAAGMPNLGMLPVLPGHVNDLLHHKRILDILLDSNETFLGLTERNALYFYLDRPLPIETGALYNLPNDRQQLRAIARLEAKPVPVVLTPDGPDGVFDGGPASLRTYAIYRYLIWRYVPVRIDRTIYLVTPDRLRRLSAHPELPVETAAAPLLDAAFRRSDLEGVPRSWGASWSTLASQADQVRDLNAPAVATPDQAAVTGPNHYRATGPAPSVIWDFSATPIAGKTAGLMVFEFACPSTEDEVQLEAAWAAPGAPFDTVNSVRFTSGARVVVPLDASPRWLLAPAIGRLQVRVLDASRCPEFTVAHATLWQRHIVTHTDPR